MFVNVKAGMMFQYYCSKCGYKREGLLDHPMYSWNCPKCGGFSRVELVEGNMPEQEKIKNLQEEIKAMQTDPLLKEQYGDKIRELIKLRRKVNRKSKSKKD